MVKRAGSTAQRLKETPYEKRVCMWENYPGCLSRPGFAEGLGVEQLVELIHEQGLQVQVVSGMHDKGTPRFHSKMILPHPNVDQDELPKFLELAHQKGIIVLSYYGFSASKPLSELHPEWLMEYLEEPGRKPPDESYWFCFNSPYRDWLTEFLTECLDNLDLDGFYFDGTNWGSHGPPPYFVSCCCEYCRRLFKEETHLEIPTKVDFDSTDFRRFLNWRCKKFTDFIAHITRKVRAAYPDAILDFNHYGGVYNNWTMGHPVGPLHVEDAGGYSFMERTIYDGSSLMAKYGRAQGGTSGVWFGPTQSMPECSCHTAPYPEPLSMTIHCLAAMANGTKPILAMLPYPSKLNDECIKSVFTAVKKRADYIEGRTVKYVGMHWSQRSRDFHRPSPDHYASGAEYFKRISGTYEILNQSHLLTDVVFDEQLTYEYIPQYKVLFLSNSACLSARQCEDIRRFVDEGGTLIATHETSLQDELGRTLDNFQLADVLGVDYQGPAADGEIHGVIYVPHDELLSSKLGYLMCYAAAESKVSLRRASDAVVLATRSSLTGPTDLAGFEPESDYDSGEPGIICRRFGKGKVIYITGDVGRGYAHNPYPPLKRFVAELVRRTTPPIELEAPKVLEMTAATRGPNELMIHLLNNPTPYFSLSQSAENAHDICTYFYNLEEVNPIRDIKITFNDFAPKTARMPLQDRDLDITGRPPTVVVPEVKIHEVIILTV